MFRRQLILFTECVIKSGCCQRLAHESLRLVYLSLGGAPLFFRPVNQARRKVCCKKQQGRVCRKVARLVDVKNVRSLSTERIVDEESADETLLDELVATDSPLPGSTCRTVSRWTARAVSG